MSAHLICAGCGKEIQMRTEILAKNWRASGLTRKQYVNSYKCKDCRIDLVGRNQRSLQDTSVFRSFANKLKAAYRNCAESGLTKSALMAFQQSVNNLMKENHIQKFEYVISSGMLRAIKLVDFPVFGTFDVELV